MAAMHSGMLQCSHKWKVGLGEIVALAFNTAEDERAYLQFIAINLVRLKTADTVELGS